MNPILLTTLLLVFSSCFLEPEETKKNNPTNQVNTQVDSLKTMSPSLKQNTCYTLKFQEEVKYLYPYKKRDLSDYTQSTMCPSLGLLESDSAKVYLYTDSLKTKLWSKNKTINKSYSSFTNYHVMSELENMGWDIDLDSSYVDTNFNWIYEPIEPGILLASQVTLGTEDSVFILENYPDYSNHSILFLINNIELVEGCDTLSLIETIQNTSLHLLDGKFSNDKNHAFEIQEAKQEYNIDSQKFESTQDTIYQATYDNSFLNISQKNRPYFDTQELLKDHEGENKLLVFLDFKYAYNYTGGSFLPCSGYSGSPRYTSDIQRISVFHMDYGLVMDFEKLEFSSGTFNKNTGSFENVPRHHKLSMIQNEKLQPILEDILQQSHYDVSTGDSVSIANFLF